MLNNISYIESVMTENVMKPRPRFGMRACLVALAPAATPATEGAVASARTRHSADVTAGAAGQNPVLVPIDLGTGRSLSGTQFAYMTPGTASGSGALGSHPAREPV